MEGTMKAMVLEGPGRLVYQQVPIPKIGPRDILFKISYAAVCGGDLPAYRDLHYLQHTPIIIGHEFTGYVVEVGDQVKDIPVGMRFMGTSIEGCGECEVCKNGGKDWECPYSTKYGLGFGRDGVFAEYSVIHHAQMGVSVHPLPDSINDMVGATCEPMCVGIGNVGLIKPQPRGERIVIYGAGIIGQSFIQAFKAECEQCEIAVVDVSDFRLELARQSGADYIINPAQGKSAYDVLAEAWGYGEYAYHDRAAKPCGNATIAVECTSNMGCVAEAMDIVTQNGKVCYAAGYGDDDKALIHPVNLMMKGVQVIPGLMGNFAKSVQYMAEGKFRTEHLITHVYPLEQLDEAIHKSMDSKHSCKVCIKVDPAFPDYPYNKQD